MSETQHFVILGGGLTGATAARTLREEGFDGKISIIAEENHIPYLRPPLAKEFLKGEDEREKVFIKPAEFYEENNIDLSINTKATAIDAESKTVQLSNGSTLKWDKLLIATGARPTVLNIENADQKGVYYLRTLDDSEALKAALAEGNKKVAVIGSGWIGLEAAAAAIGYNNTVHVISAAEIPLQRAMGDVLGKMFENMHEQHGVIFHNRAHVERFTAENGHITGVVTDSGTVEADLIIVGIGAQPNSELAENAGIALNNGSIQTNDKLETSITGIYAAGDVATCYHPFVEANVHSEHWANALKGGKTVAKSMLGQDIVYDEVPYFYSDQFEINMEYAGFAALTEGAEVVFRGDVETYKFIAFWVNDVRVVAGMNVNIWKVNKKIRDLIQSRKQVDLDQLKDPEVPIDEL